MSASSNACGLCGITRRQHDIQWVDTVPHRWVPPAATARTNSQKGAAR
ncbi:hypothetical protein [Kitasatospora griseola]